MHIIGLIDDEETQLKKIRRTIKTNAKTNEQYDFKSYLISDNAGVPLTPDRFCLYTPKEKSIYSYTSEIKYSYIFDLISLLRFLHPAESLNVLFR